MQWSLVCANHVHALCIDHFPRVKWHLVAKLISSFLMLLACFPVLNWFTSSYVLLLALQFAYGVTVGEWLKVYHAVVTNAGSIQMLSVPQN